MTHRFNRLALAPITLCLMAAVAPAQATPALEIDADNLVRGAGHMKESLGLNPNQQILWQQVASKSAGLLRARQTRRDKLQAALKTGLQAPQQELRELSASIEQESATSALENRELRELWLSLNDALSDQQRLAVNGFLLSQLERVDAPPRAADPGRGEGPDGGQRRPKPGADMGGARR